MTGFVVALQSTGDGEEGGFRSSYLPEQQYIGQLECSRDPGCIETKLDE